MHKDHTDSHTDSVPDGGVQLTTHPALIRLFGLLAQDDGFVSSEPNWIAFYSDDAYVEATAKRGHEDVVTFEAYILLDDGGMRSEQEISNWIAQQPQPLLGMLTVGVREIENDEKETAPVFTMDILVTTESTVAEFIDDHLRPLADAWQNSSVADFGEGLHRDLEQFTVAPLGQAPRNAWLLMGDEASYPDEDWLSLAEAEGEAGIYDSLWTGPKNGEFGDLALLYFTSPRKSVCFVARLASRPYWDTEAEVGAARTVNQHQWWTYLTAPVSIEPISYAQLTAAHHGHLLLRGRSGHYLSPETIAALPLRAEHPEQQGLVNQVARTPIGPSELPDPNNIDFEEWKAIPSGLLPLEAKVSEYIVKPLRGFIADAPDTTEPLRLDQTLGPIVDAEYRVTGGFVDFVYHYAGQPALAIEVKLTTLRPASGLWSDSPDFVQLRRYMDALDVPGLLIDAQRILLVKVGADEPIAEVVRGEATWDDMALIRDLILDAAEAKYASENPIRNRVTARRAARRG